MENKIPKFVKWAGGKTQLIEQFKPFFPQKIERYFEPFVGSGAVFFYVINNYNPSEIFLSDINEELITTYKVIRDKPEELIVELKKHKEAHMANSTEYYYKIRNEDIEGLSNIQIAARFIYLNKTCFNGLYRVNSKGKFNVPIGSYKNPDILQEEKIKIISQLLKNVKLEVRSFEKIVEITKEGDFIYFDPPYYPLKKGKSFTTYAKGNFLEKEQERLAEVFKELDKKGCYVMKSNSDTEYIEQLFSGYNISRVKATRLINSNSEGRGEINELVITNY